MRIKALIIVSSITLFYCSIWLVILSLSCALSVFTQNKLASINTYIIGIFGMAAIIYIPSIQNLILYLTVYIAFFFTLPLFQPDPFIIEVFRTNAFVMNVFAWILSGVVFRMRIVHFLNNRQIEEKNELLKDLVRRDSMTSLLNHETSHKMLHSELERAKQIAYPLSLIMIDIDNFKLVNDRYGHIAGDNIIKRVASFLIENCRKTDIICRYGGEEFLIILPNTNLNDSVILANRIRDTIEKSNMENEIQFTISGGICELQNEKTVEELIKKADMHLYAAKSNGKNRFEPAFCGLNNPV